MIETERSVKLGMHFDEYFMEKFELELCVGKKKRTRQDEYFVACFDTNGIIKYISGLNSFFDR